MFDCCRDLLESLVASGREFSQSYSSASEKSYLTDVHVQALYEGVYNFKRHPFKFVIIAICHSI